MSGAQDRAPCTFASPHLAFPQAIWIGMDGIRFICDIFKDGDDEREYYSVVHFICGGILASHQPQTLLITRSPHTALPVDLFYDQTLTLSLLGINWFAHVINDNTTHGFNLACF